MTLQLELGGIEDPDVRRAFENVAQQFPLRALNIANDVLLLAVTGTKRKVAFGVDTVTFTASQISSIKTVTHGLGGTPVIAGAFTQGATIFAAWYGCQNYTATTFDVYGNTTTASTGSGSFTWVAIG